MKLIEFLQWYNYDCGAAVIYAAALSFGVDPGDYEDVVKAICHPKIGTPPHKLRKYLRKLKLKVRTKHRLTIEQLDEIFKSSDVLILAPIKAFAPVSNDGHWVIIYKVNHASIHFFCPWKGKIAWPIDKFLDRWYDVDADGKYYKQYGLIIYGRNYA